MRQQVTSHIYDAGLSRHAKPNTRRPDDSKVVGAGKMQAEMLALKPSNSITFKADCAEAQLRQFGISELFSLYHREAFLLNKKLGREAFFVVAKRGEQDKQSVHLVKYNARKVKKVANPGGIIQFQVFRV